MKMRWGRAVCAIVLGLTLGSNSTPAHAAGTNVVVDDDLRCPGATFSDLQDAIDFVGGNPGTITVCAGIYRGQFQVVNANNLKLIGAKGAVIAPSFAGSALFTGVLLNVDRSANVTVQGFTFDGQSALQTFGDPNAIQYFDSTGTIQKNTVSNWHRPAFRPADVVNGKPAGLLHAIHAIGFTVIPGEQQGRQVNILKNTITEFQERGMDAEGDLTVTISGNKTSPGLPADPASTFSQAINIGPASTTGLKTPTGVVKGNIITGHGGTSGENAIDSGILARQAGFLTISGNKIDHVVIGVNFFANCLSPPNSSNNTVKTNKITESITGIQVTAIGGFAGACDPHVDNYVITSNRIVNNFRDPLDFGLSGIQFDIRGSGTGQAFALNETVQRNTITFFNFGVFAPPQSGGTITGTFDPNHFLPAL
jgi:hypothetical protein